MVLRRVGQGSLEFDTVDVDVKHCSSLFHASLLSKLIRILGSVRQRSAMAAGRAVTVSLHFLEFGMAVTP